MTPTQAKIHIERMMHRSSIAVAGDSAASYALVKLIPAGGSSAPLALNLAIVQDVSQKVDMFDVDPGGTAMDQGITNGMAELEKNVAAGKLSQMILLTDGET